MAAFRSAASGCAATTARSAERHHAKVYGKAASGSPPMSVPHLDTRMIGGQALAAVRPLRGFLHQVPEARLADRSVPVDHARQHHPLSRRRARQYRPYRISDRAGASEFEPSVRGAEAVLSQGEVAMTGRRPSQASGSRSSSPTKTGAAPGIRHRTRAGGRQVAGRAAWRLAGGIDRGFIAMEVLRTCFGDRLTDGGWLPALKRMIPTYGIDLNR